MTLEALEQETRIKILTTVGEEAYQTYFESCQLVLQDNAPIIIVFPDPEQEQWAYKLYPELMKQLAKTIVSKAPHCPNTQQSKETTLEQEENKQREEDLLTDYEKRQQNQKEIIKEAIKERVGEDNYTAWFKDVTLSLGEDWEGEKLIVWLDFSSEWKRIEVIKRFTNIIQQLETGSFMSFDELNQRMKNRQKK